MSPKIPSRRLFGLDILAAGFDEAVELLAQSAAGGDGCARVVVTPNVDHIVRLDKDRTLRQIYARADFIFADGMPVLWASRLLRRPLPARVTGADLFVAMCHEAVTHDWRVALIGGMPGQEAMIRERFETYYPGLRIDVTCPSMSFEPLGEEGERIASRIRETAPHLIFVCLGLPKQEYWAMRHAPTLPRGVIFCVGAAMEFAIGMQRRAPHWVQRIGAEWLWRLVSNPRRLWRRYLVEDTRFLSLCWREWRERAV